MKKLMTSALVVLGFAFAGMAQADTQGPAWVCNIDGEMSGTSVGLIVGFQELKGTGMISCKSAFGERVEQPVILRMTGLGLGLGFADIKSVKIFTAAIGVTSGPEALLGKFKVGLSTGATLAEVGADADLALALSNEGVGFEVGVTGRKAQGLEAHLHAITFTIKPLN